MQTLPTLRALLAGLTLSLTAAAPAAADSISFIRDHDIWLTTPDGSRQFRVTETGNYSYASQADDGTVIARIISAEKLQKLDRFGKVLAEFDTPVSDGPTPPAGSANYFSGPYEPEISPDGKTVAYSYYWQHYTYDPMACGGQGCMANRLDSGTAITHSDRLTPWSDFGGHLSGWIQPSWASNDQLVRANAGVAMSENVVVNTIKPGGGGELNRWLKEAYTDERQDAEVNRQHTKMALVDATAAPDNSWTTWEGIRVYDMPNGFAAAPVGCFRWGMTSGNDHVSSPTWAPGGDKLAWEENGALMTMPVGSLSGENCKAPAGVEPAKVLDKVQQPDWGPADVPTARPAAAPVTTPGTTAGSGGSGSDGSAGPATEALTATVRKAKLAAVLRSGLTLRLAAPLPAAAKATAKRGRTTVAAGAAKAGARAITLRFTRKAKASLRRARAAKLVVDLTAGGAKQQLHVTVKR